MAEGSVGQVRGQPVARGPDAVRAIRDLLEAERARWFCWLPVLFGSGIAVYFWLPVEPPLGAAVAPLVLALAMRGAGPRAMLAVLVLDVVLVVALGFLAAKLRTDRVAAPVLRSNMGPVLVRGHVELVEPREVGGERITIRVVSLGDLAAEELPRRVRVRALARASGLAPGGAIRVSARIAPPAPPVLPGGYDFARQAWFMGLGGVGFAVSRPEADPTIGPPPTDLAVAGAVQRLRQAIGKRVAAVLPGQTGAIATALITGERGAISEATNTAYRDSGLVHVLSISGLHMAVMGGAVFYAVRLALALVPALALAYPIKKWAALAAIVGSFGYLAISGSTFPTVRSFIMISIMFLAILLDRPALALRNVALAALVILVAYPESLLDVGFQMSFAAVLALVSAYEFVREHGAERARGGFGPASRLALFLGGIVLSTLVASLAVAPLALYHFHKSQLYAVLANLLAIPVCNVIVMPGVLASLVLMPSGLEAPALIVMGFGIDIMTWVASFVAGMPGAVARHPAISAFAFVLIVAGGLWLTLWHRAWRFAGLAAISVGVVLASLHDRPDVLVGRDGRLVAIRADGSRLAVAAGDSFGYEIDRWLESDGDGRDARSASAATAGSGLRCDAIGCVGIAKGLTVAVSRHPAALAEDCQRADILVLDVPRPAGCVRPATVIDFLAVRAAGTHALYIAPDGTVRVETVAGVRGIRPWSPAHEWAGKWDLGGVATLDNGGAAKPDARDAGPLRRRTIGTAGRENE